MPKAKKDNLADQFNNIDNLKSLLNDDPAAFDQFVSQDLEKLQKFTERELEYHDALNELAANELDALDVIDEAIAKTLENNQGRPIKVNQTLYKTILDILHEKVGVLEERERRELSLEENAKDAKEEDGFRTLGEHVLDFWQPDQDFAKYDFLADEEVPSPAEILDLKDRQKEIYQALDSLPKQWREDFVLLAIERWPLREIAEMRGLNEENLKKELTHVQAFMQARLREHLQLDNRSRAGRLHRKDKGSHQGD